MHFPRFAPSLVLGLASTCGLYAMPAFQFGSALDFGSDINGDGVPEVIAGDPSAENGHGAVYVFDGAAGRILRSFSNKGGMAGYDVACVMGPDPKVAAVAFSSRRLDCFSLRTGETVWESSLDLLNLAEETLTALYLDVVDSANPDGHDDVLLHGRGKSGLGWYAVFAGLDGSCKQVSRLVGRAPAETRIVYYIPSWSKAISGVLAILSISPAVLEIQDIASSGTLLRIPFECEDVCQVYGRQRAVAFLGDINSDGTGDLAVSLACRGGLIRALSGADGKLLWERTCVDIGTKLGNAIISYHANHGHTGGSALLVAGYEPFSECIIHEPIVGGIKTWKSGYVGPYLGWEISARASHLDSSVFVAASAFSPFAKSPEEIYVFLVGEEKPRLVLKDPAK